LFTCCPLDAGSLNFTQNIRCAICATVACRQWKCCRGITVWSDTFSVEKCIVTNQPFYVCQMTKGNPLPLIAPILNNSNKNPFSTNCTSEIHFPMKLHQLVNCADRTTVRRQYISLGHFRLDRAYDPALLFCLRHCTIHSYSQPAVLGHPNYLSVSQACSPQPTHCRTDR
jgi:hypothetical protein